MSLRLQINLIVGALTVLFVALLLALQVKNLRESVHEEVVAANRVAAQMLKRTASVQAAQGTPGMLAYLRDIGRVRSNDFMLFDHQGDELYRSPPSPYKAGRDAPAWFAALIAPEPSVQQIDFPDGQLVVTANASRAELDAWDFFVPLAGGALALLLVVNLLVAWGVGRAVRPFGRIVGALNQLEGGRFDVALPHFAGREAGALAAAFNRMVGVLQQRIEAERRAVMAEQQLSDSRDLTRWIDHHIEKERHMIARELHDELGQSVTAIRSMALSVAQRMQPLDAEAERAARLIAAESSRLYDAMHGLIPRLTPLVLDNFGLADALADLAEQTRRSHAGLQLELEVDLAGARLSGDAALALYRTAQEGITNALRHGHACRIELRVSAGLDVVTLRLLDNGSGLPEGWQQRPGHYGLRWLRERVESLRGSLTLESAPRQGVQLQVTLPREAA
jgi:two-component system sensor histidine kinase UhpB